jgi:hypothetical protein
MKTELSGTHAGASITETTSADAVNDILMAGNKSKGGRPYFLDDPAVERVLNISMAVAAEVAVLHERMDTIERLLEAKGVLTKKEIEEYVPDDQAAEERQTWHARFTARILRIVQQEVEAVAHPENNVPMRTIADEINEM